MALGPVAQFFLLFALPSSVLAILGLREFMLRAEGPPGRRVRRGGWLMVAAGAVAALMLLASTALTAGAPLRTGSGLGFLAFGGLMAALGPFGAWLFHRAAGVPHRRLVKAAETVPLMLVLLNLVLVANAARLP